MYTSVRTFHSRDALATAAAAYIRDSVMDAVGVKGWCALVLSGGETPRQTYECLAVPGMLSAAAWEQVHLFWGDERCVPPGNPQSNYAMADKALISRIPIPGEHIHRIAAETGRPEDVARDYENEIRFFYESQGSEGLPAFDLVLLGIGTDGHTASLFPGDPVLDEKKRWVRAVRAPHDIRPRQRVTLTLPLINNARQILFLAGGSSKRRIVQAVLRDGFHASAGLPAARVCARNETVWFIDEQED